MERLTPTVRALIVAISLVYFFFLFTPPLNDWVIAHALLGPRLRAGEVWQPVTALFVHTRFLSWLFSVIGLWWVGAFVERTRGRRFFLTVFFGSGIAANLVMAAVMFALDDPGVRSDGVSFALTAVFVTFARIYGSRPAQIWGAFHMRADYFVWILIGFSLLVGVANRDWPGIAGELVAIAAALAATGASAELRQRWHAARARRRYRVLEGGARRKPPYLN